MLDAFTLRIALGVVAVCVLVLTYFITYRSTRSPYSGWWSLSLVAFGPGALLYLLNGTPLQVIANPLGNVVLVLGALCVLTAVRSLRSLTVPSWVFATLALVVFVPAMFDDPANDVWPAGALFLFTMSAVLGTATFNLRQLVVQSWRDRSYRAEYRRSVVSMALVSVLCSVYYFLRAVFFVALGPDHRVFQTGFGTPMTCLFVMLLLVVASFSVSTLSYETEASALRDRAARDSLTGLYNRSALLREVWVLRRAVRADQALTVIIADLDRFKSVNDDYGHLAGDHALVAFARACEGAVGDQGLVARLGGDEFVLVTHSIEMDELTRRIEKRYLAGADGHVMPTVSYGAAALDAGEDILETIERADQALYRAKAAGRDRAMHYGDVEGR